MTAAPGPGAARRRRTAAAIAVLVALTCAVFSPVARNGFVHFDDEKYLTNNPIVLRGISAEGVRLAFSGSHASNWHPLTWLSHMADVELFGLESRGHHLVSVAIHAAAAALLLLSVDAMTGRAGLAFGAAALFALHPLRVESVAWAAERKDVLCALLWMGTVLAWVRHLRRPSAGRYGAALALFAAALMAKPMAVTLPLVLLVLDWWPLGRSRGGVLAAGAAAAPHSPGRLLLEKAPFFALAAGSALVTLGAQAGGEALSSLEAVPAAARVANAFVSVVAYLGSLAFPRDLAFYYPGVVGGPAGPAALAAAMVVAAASLGVYGLRKQAPWLLAGWAWYLVVLLPVLGLVQVGGQARADRYSYLPSVGIAIALFWQLDALGRRAPRLGSALWAGAVAAVVLLAALTPLQVGVWRDPERLYRHALAVTEGNWMAAFNLGYSLDRAGRPGEAEPLYREAIRLRPGYAKARYDLALLLLDAGRVGEGLEQVRAAVAAEPDDPVFRMALAQVLERQGRAGEAIAELRELIRRRPRTPEAYNNLAALLAARGERREAASLLRRALEIDPAFREARVNLGALTVPSGGGALLGGRDAGAPDGAAAPGR